jgi:hypothetical protein
MGMGLHIVYGALLSFDKMDVMRDYIHTLNRKHMGKSLV